MHVWSFAEYDDDDDERGEGEVSPVYPPAYPSSTRPHQIQPAPVTTLRTTVPAETRQWPTYGSVATMSVTSQPNRAKTTPTKRYRLPLIILLAFDWGLVVFFSVVVMKVCYLSLVICALNLEV